MSKQQTWMAVAAVAAGLTGVPAAHAAESDTMACTVSVNYTLNDDKTVKFDFVDGRGQVLPEDLQAILPGVVGHRLFVARDSARINGAAVAENLIEAVAIP